MPLSYVVPGSEQLRLVCCGIEPAGNWLGDRSDASCYLRGLGEHLSLGGHAVQLYSLLVASSLDACSP